MLVQRRRRWPNIKAASVQRLLLGGDLACLYLHQLSLSITPEVADVRTALRAQLRVARMLVRNWPPCSVFRDLLS